LKRSSCLFLRNCSIFTLKNLIKCLNLDTYCFMSIQSYNHINTYYHILPSILVVRIFSESTNSPFYTPWIAWTISPSIFLPTPHCSLFKKTLIHPISFPTLQELISKYNCVEWFDVFYGVLDRFSLAKVLGTNKESKGKLHTFFEGDWTTLDNILGFY